MTRVAVVTMAAGRHEHLKGLLWGLSRQVRRPDLLVVVSMGDPEVSRIAASQPGHVCSLEVTPAVGGLPLAAARNAGAAAAVAAGADVLVVLDVDCIPSPGLVGRYADVLRGPSLGPPRVACGEVAYLPDLGDPLRYRDPGVLSSAEPHPARPHPAHDEVLPDGDVRLFWSLSFAMTATDWQRVGGFCEDYVGYGAEDTDFGQRLRSAGGELLWVGGAAAYHQYHEVERPPTRHLTSIVRNANLFCRTWGWFPMTGWLDGFAAAGLASTDPETGYWRVLPPGGTLEAVGASQDRSGGTAS